MMFTALLVLLFALRGIALPCPDTCSDTICVEKQFIVRFCKSGHVLDTCNCCFVCAKKFGESCGGYMDIYGKCGHGLHCLIPRDSLLGKCVQNLRAQEDPSAVEQIAKDPTRLEKEPTQSTEICMPECTANYCFYNIGGICSARNNVLNRRSCQGNCQHTTCGACFQKRKSAYVCPKCTKNDYECMDKYAKCMRKKSCRKWSFIARRKHERGFVCHVPECL